MKKRDSLRSTVIFTDIQAHNLELLGLEINKGRGELVREGVDLILKQHGYPTDKKVTFTVKKT